MQFFIYRAKDDKGKTVKGKVEAQTIKQASLLLREKNLFVISINPSQESDLTMFSTVFDRVKFNDIVNFTRQLSTMITAGLPLTEAFTILENQSKSAMRKVVMALSKEIEGGSSLGDAMEKQDRKIFSLVYVALVRAGEAAGVLDTILKQLADNLEKQREFQAKTKSAMIYPSIVLTAMGIVSFIMMTFVVPKLTVMYQDFNAQLPLPTVILMAISNFFVHFWYVVIVGTVGVIYGVRAWKKSPVGAEVYDRFMLKLPVMGPLRKQIVLTEFTRTISLLLSSGISLLTALDIVADALDNLLFRDAVKKVARYVEKGVSLADAVARFPIFPQLLTEMVAVGEQTGKLDEVMLKLSAFYESESDHAVKNLTTAIEPLIIIVLAVGVGFIMLAIIMPIYNLTSQF